MNDGVSFIKLCVGSLLRVYVRPEANSDIRHFLSKSKFNLNLAYAEAGVGRACAEFEIFEAEAKGPNVYAGAEANVFGAGAMARAEIASASASAGPVGVKVGLGFDTGATVGLAGVEVKVLGIGFSIGPKTSISFLGSEVSCSVM